jgi:hypothetical protein
MSTLHPRSALTLLASTLVSIVAFSLTFSRPASHILSDHHNVCSRIFGEGFFEGKLVTY